jgi:hypothetical protein
MAILQTSGSYTFSQSAIDIISAALRICQVINEEETPTGAQLANSLAALNAMVKGWQVSGIHLWAEEEAILFPQPKQSLYYLGSTSSDHATLYNQLTMTTLSATALAGATTLNLTSGTDFNVGDNIGIQLDAGTNFWTTVATAPGSNVVTIAAALPSQATAGTTQQVFDYTTPLVRPLRAYTMRRYIYNSGIENPMIMLSRSDYQNLPNKQNQGTITQGFFDPQTGTGQGAYTVPLAQVNLWPSPLDNQSGFRFTAQRALQDFTDLANLPDLPVEWTTALKWNLAQEIGPELSTPMDQMSLIGKMSETWFGRIQMWDREPESVMFGVAFEPGYHSGV